ncbi:cilia- and flagella-associated protein 45-like [Genypterus blacodes]|uniref:cilia- and flagella-associated protein 45-like n=1 Tax=Genypterus blacodes TaxID=154954 RepID=UPI003F76C9CF
MSKEKLFRQWETGSSASRRSGNSGNHRYRTRALTSQVDETLFGNPAPKEILAQSDRRGASKMKAKDQRQKSREGERIHVITKDLIREIEIPCKDPSGRSVILPSDRIEKISSLLNKEERETMEEGCQRKREEKAKSAEEWKRQLQEADLSRQVDHALSELELEARDRAQHLLGQANDFKMEQEEEIKMLNKLILSAQCHAGCDAQMLEKKEIQEVLAGEDKRLDDIMATERRKALENQKKIQELHKQRRISGRELILEQIKERQEERDLQLELKDQEGKQLLQNQEKLNKEELKALEKKREEQSLLQQEIMRINAETLRVKEVKKEEERQADIKAMEYINNKMEKEAEYEAEQKRKKKEKEKETEKLRALQQREKDYKADLDALRARRNQEKTEREWRIKEKQLAGRKAQEDAMLKAARLEQIKYREHMVGIKVGQEKAEAERLLRVQQEAIAKEKEEEERQRQKLLRHSAAIRQQVRERELIAMAQRKEIFKEGDKLNEAARQRRIRLEDFKEKKLRELKATGIPDKYCKEVERKAHASVF